ncbi:hypothetical protein MNBD_GAMMA03-1591 [hydrothermal vent metagenome]|uniref:Uncharacterized protein n=1 Tax=hydrothermal vent metagenome TaxID=652676 RepID=A0A3B0W8V5_9ZZZZ
MVVKMINNKITATKINNLMLEFGAKLDNTVNFVKKECNQSDFDAYKKGVGKIMGTMLLEIMNPIYKEHPDLKPKELN